MKISQQTIEVLEAMYSCGFYDNNANVLPADKASELYIGWERETGKYIGKTIKAKKGEMSLEWIMSKIEAGNAYKNFADSFNAIVRKEGLHGYPTTYGIGVFCAIGFRSSIQKTKDKIESTLTEMGVKFTTEYSQAGWVFRYKISKAESNINRIKELAL